jgi:hypothetical protein
MSIDGSVIYVFLSTKRGKKIGKMMYTLLLAAVSTLAVVPQPVERAIEQVEPRGGWAVCVGTTDGATEIALAQDERWVVTGLAYDRAAGETARNAAAKVSVAGRAAFHEVMDSSRLCVKTWAKRAYADGLFLTRNHQLLACVQVGSRAGDRFSSHRV